MLALSLSAIASTSFANDLETALALEEQGRLGEALRAFEQVLRNEGNSREELATIYLHLGLLRLASDDSDGAQRAMRRLLSVSDEVSLPGTAPPELRTMLDEAIDERGDRRLSMEIEIQRESPSVEEVELRIDVRHDLIGMVAGARAMSDAQVLSETRGQSPLNLPVERGDVEDGRRLVVQLIDEHGGALVEQEVSDELFSTDDSAHTSTVDEPSAPRCAGCRVSGWTLAIGGALALGGGVPLILIDGAETGDTRLVDGREQREEYTTSRGGWAMLGLGAAALITGIVLLIVERRRAAATPRAELLSVSQVLR